MNAKEFIEKHLQDCQYRNELTREAENIAKDNNLVVVFGASDDLCEFRGAADDEVGCYDGGDIYIRADGEIFGEDYWEANDFEPEGHPDYHLIQAVWCGKDAGCAWSYKTDIPHEEFLVYEDDELYCRGIVFSLDDLPHKTSDILRKAINKYGADAQTAVAMEEAAELIQAISKCRRYGNTGKYRDNLIEEIADVRVCIEQLMLIYDISEDDISKVEVAKILRLEDKMKPPDFIPFALERFNMNAVKSLTKADVIFSRIAKKTPKDT